MMNVSQFVTWFLTEPLGRPLLKTLGFDSTSLKRIDEDGLITRAGENLRPSSMGKVIERLSRYMITKDPKVCTRINSSNKRFRKILESTEAYRNILEDLRRGELTDKLIINMSLLLQYEVLFKAGFRSNFPSHHTIPNRVTIRNIRTMVLRSVKFLQTFENLKSHANYSRRAFAPCQIIGRGVGDFRTNKYLIEMRAQSSRYLSSKHVYECILQCLLNKNMGIKIEKIYVFMPRTGIYYESETKLIPQYIINTIKKLW